MNAIGDRAPTSEYGAVRRAQKAVDAGMQGLIDDVTGAALAPGTPPATPRLVTPKPGSTVGVVA
jgi:hypothetical protein